MRVPELYQIVLVEGVVVLVEIQSAAFDEGGRILLADEPAAKLSGTRPVAVRVDVPVGHAMELADDRQRKDPDRGEPLLAVDDEEFTVALRLNDHGAM